MDLPMRVNSVAEIDRFLEAGLNLRYTKVQ